MKMEHARGIPTAKETPASSTTFEHIRDLHAEMMKYVERLGRYDRESGKLERLDPRRIQPKKYRDMSFFPDLYAVEPAALDDLAKAKQEKDKERIETLRSVIRAMSWATHGRTDADIAAKISETFLRDAQAESESVRRGTRKPQTGFEYSSLDSAEWTRVLNTLHSIDCRGEILEKSTDFVERKIVDVWKELLTEFRAMRSRRSPRSDWPTSYPVAENPPKLSKRVREIDDRLVRLRHVRDQLYYQLLYPKHCMYARASVTRNP